MWPYLEKKCLSRCDYITIPRWEHPGLSGCALTPTRALMRNRRGGIQRRGMQRWKQWCGHSQGLPTGTWSWKSREGFSPRALVGSVVLRHLDFRLLAPQSCERMHSCCLSARVCGNFLQQPQETKSLADLHCHGAGVTLSSSPFRHDFRH